jgi:L-amino acid N-acyltransferase YncA
MIRLSSIEDLPQIVDIYNQTIPLGYVTADTEKQSIDDRLDWYYQFNEKRPLWVMEEDNKIVAWCSLKSFYGRPAYNITVEIGIYVHEDYRQARLGESLLLYAFQESKKLEIETILAFIFAHNIGSMHFFKKHGFIEYGLLPGVARNANQYIDLAILGYKL